MLREKIPMLIMLFLFGFMHIGATFVKENIRVHVLDNGLKILLFEDHSIPNIAYYTFFRVGSRNERVGLTGVSHFIEHMMFNGTKGVGPGEFDRIMEFNGGANNAYTSDDITAYTDWFPASALEEMMRLESDRMQGVLFDATVLESERGVVASERRLSVENNPENLLQETVRATAIMAHPYHWDVIGWMSDILSWKRDEIIAYYRQYYSPNNAVLVLVGDFEPQAALALIEKNYGDIPRGPEPPPVATTEPEQMGPKKVILYRDVQTASFLTVYHAPACVDSLYPAMRVLEIVLLEGESSRLYRKLVSESQLALNVSGGTQETVDPFLFYIGVKPRQDADLQRIEAVVDAELAQLTAEGISANELQKALNIVRTRFYDPLQSIAGKANILGHTEVMYGSYEALFTQMDLYRSLTLETVQRAAVRYFAPEQKTLGLVLPKGGGR